MKNVGLCWFCNRHFAIRRDGALRVHFNLGKTLEFSPPKVRCPGSGKPEGDRVITAAGREKKGGAA